MIVLGVLAVAVFLVVVNSWLLRPDSPLEVPLAVSQLAADIPTPTVRGTDLERDPPTASALAKRCPDSKVGANRGGT